MALKHAIPGEVVNLNRMYGKMTVAIVKNKQFEIIHLIVKPNKPISVHSLESPINIRCLEGKRTFFVKNQPHELTPGFWLYLDDMVKHRVEAQETSKLLLTVLF